MEPGKAKRWGFQYTQKIAESKPVNGQIEVILNNKVVKKHLKLKIL